MDLGQLCYTPPLKRGSIDNSAPKWSDDSLATALLSGTGQTAYFFSVHLFPLLVVTAWRITWFCLAMLSF